MVVEAGHLGLPLLAEREILQTRAHLKEMRAVLGLLTARLVVVVEQVLLVETAQVLHLLLVMAETARHLAFLVHL